MATALPMVGNGDNAQRQRPNLLIIHTDEHNIRTLGCHRKLMDEKRANMWGMGNVVETPNIDRIADEGAICANYYATSPVCSPSRASFISGLYPIATGVPSNNKHLKDEVLTFAEMLRREGYSTSYLGKWHLDGDAKPGFAPVRQFGFSDNRFMWNRGHWKKMGLKDDGSPMVGSVGKNGQPSSNVKGADEKSFTTDWLTDRTLEILERDHNKPFCLMVSIPDPHTPNTVRPPYDTMYADMPFEAPHTQITRPKGTLPSWRSSEGKNAGKPFRKQELIGYFGMVKCIDDNVGRLLDYLDEKGLAEDTIVVFTSDHGDMLFEHDRLNKGQPFEGSAHIPFVIRYPRRIKAGKVIHKAYSTADFAPTVLALMGAQALPNTHGINDAETLMSARKDIKDERISYMACSGGRWAAAMTYRHKLVYSSEGEPWLFDLEKDPDELINFYTDPAYKTVRERLHCELVKKCELIKGPEYNKVGLPIFRDKGEITEEEYQKWIED